MRIACGVEYDGTAFQGWQRQPADIASIQASVESAIARVADHPIQTVCAGRTDRGVHASGQVIHFDTTATRTPYQWQQGIQTYLPSTIRLPWIRPISEDFHARYSALARRYRYVLYHRPTASALAQRYATWFRHPLCVPTMQDAAQYFVGEHDFSAFRGAHCQSHTPIRRIFRIAVTLHGAHWIVVDILGNAFLHHMVRNIVGTLCQIGRGFQPVSQVPYLLACRDRTQAGIMAPAEGLHLTQVYYPSHFAVPTSDGPFFLPASPIWEL